MSQDPSPSHRGTSHRGTSSRWSVTAFVVVLSAASWWVWMGWDTSYQVDSETGAVTGPYAVWQVIGCVLTLVVGGSWAARVLPVWILLPALVIPFVGSWAVSAVDSADSGLWVVGLVLLTVGMTLTTLLLGVLARWAWLVLGSPGPRRS